MKKNILLIVSVCTLTISVYSQTYFRFPDSNTVWTILRCVTSIDYSNYPPDTITDTNCDMIYETLLGDTIIQDKLYHKIYLGDTLGSFKNYIGAIREDSLKKVYVIFRNDSTTEYLQYNFAAQIGDTMGMNPVGVVDKIDSIFIGNSYRKTYILSNSDTTIEGIGNIIIPLGLVPISFPILREYYLLCMKQNDSLIYLNKTYNTCDTSFFHSNLDIYSNLKSKQELNIYPNPATDEITIEFNMQNKTKDITICLYNIMGTLVYTEILKYQQDILKKQLNLSGLSNGLYFMQVRVGNKVYGKKIIKDAYHK